MAELLRLQGQHICGAPNRDERVLRPRRVDVPPYPPQIEGLLRVTGFYWPAQIGHWHFVPRVVSALIERWRPETHTFHLPVGEVTITLEDVAYQMGLPIDGTVVSGVTALDWKECCLVHFGEHPQDEEFRGGRVRTSWLRRFLELPAQPMQFELERATKAYILILLGGLILPDKSGNLVHLMYLPLLADLHRVREYSWGSACLASLYRGLCRATDPTKKETSGCITLLLSWAWYRLPFLTPGFSRRHDVPYTFPLADRWRYELEHIHVPHGVMDVRRAIDDMQPHQFIWTPYSQPEIKAVIPQEFVNIRFIRMACTPLICFQYVEWHHADRAIRQFDMLQPIPQDPVNLDDQHKVDMRGRAGENWIFKHEDWIALWGRRMQQVPACIAAAGAHDPHPAYWEWFLANSLPVIGRPGMPAGQIRFVDMEAPPFQLELDRDIRRRRQRARATRSRRQPRQRTPEAFPPDRSHHPHYAQDDVPLPPTQSQTHIDLNIDPGPSTSRPAMPQDGDPLDLDIDWTTTEENIAQASDFIEQMLASQLYGSPCGTSDLASRPYDTTPHTPHQIPAFSTGSPPVPMEGPSTQSSGPSGGRAVRGRVEAVAAQGPRRNPPRHAGPPHCGTGGHLHH